MRGAGQAGRTKGTAQTRRAGWAAVAALVLASPLAAQAPRPPGPAPRAAPTIRYGKWTLAALAVGLTGLGIRSHSAAEADFRELAAWCRQGGRCAGGPDGRYLDPSAETRYQRVINDDRAARAWLIGGQVALIGSAILFVMDLRHDRGPQNIPYVPLRVWRGPEATHIGVSLPVRLP